ncbi:hypothetical protein ABZ799_28860 [Nocardiopsis dassonvillei]|uniref:hypothetical protein n=1 Tax=Nocardiopsis dassonvillei TaxID=2014 RepID=UPI0033C7F6F2
MARVSLDQVLPKDDEPAVAAPPPPGSARAMRSKNKPESRTLEEPKSGSSEEPKSGSPEEPESETHQAPKPPAPHAPVRRRKKPAAAKTSGPKWVGLERKEALLWPDQVSGLTDLRRQLQRRKRAEGGGGERITENTLIRVAVSVLLEHGDALTGVDESELRKSLSSVLRES